MGNRFALLLDFDHTLVNSVIPYDAVRTEFHTRFRVEESVFDRTYSSHKLEYGYHLPIEHIRTICQASHLSFQEHLSRMLRAYEVYYRAFERAVYPDVPLALNEVSKFASVGILSAGEIEHQLKAVYFSKLQKYCAIIRACPAKSIDEIGFVLHGLGSKTKLAVMVGDRPSDIRSYRQFASQNPQSNVLAIRIRREGGRYSTEKPQSELERPDREYKSFDKLVAGLLADIKALSGLASK